MIIFRLIKTSVFFVMLSLFSLSLTGSLAADSNFIADQTSGSVNQNQNANVNGNTGTPGSYGIIAPVNPYGTPQSSFPNDTQFNNTYERNQHPPQL